ncbi:MAG: ACT domain-containing protein [archaeon]
MTLKPEQFLNNGKVFIWKEVFAVIKSKRFYPDAYANIRDKNELTVIIDQKKYDEKEVIEIEKDWRLLTFDMVLPFELVGFMAAVSTVLADAKVSIFAVSGYSTDHILVKNKDLTKASKVLEKLGCVVKYYD